MLGCAASTSSPSGSSASTSRPPSCRPGPRDRVVPRPGPCEVEAGEGLHELTNGDRWTRLGAGPPTGDGEEAAGRAPRPGSRSCRSQDASPVARGLRIIPVPGRGGVRAGRPPARAHASSSADPHREDGVIEICARSTPPPPSRPPCRRRRPPGSSPPASADSGRSILASHPEGPGEAPVSRTKAFGKAPVSRTKAPGLSVRGHDDGGRPSEEVRPAVVVSAGGAA